MKIGLKILLLAAVVALLATALLTAIGYVTAKRQYLVGIDHTLQAVAAALPDVVGGDFLARARNNAPIADAEYDALVDKLNGIADRAGVYYVYVFQLTDDRVVHLTTSASKAERADRSYSRYREAYAEPPASLLETFKDGTTRFAEYTDEFGEFRSIFVRSADAPHYVVGVDISMDAIRRRLADVGSRHHDEVGALATRFVDVQHKLDDYLVRLTETTTQKQQIEHQLEIAKSIQESLLPQSMPDVPNFRITGWSQPADQTGGDYFDWLELQDGRLVLTIADVTGHGIGPALVTAASRAYARATFTSGENLEALVAKMNDLLHGDLKGERFVTLIACLLDPAKRHMQLIAAGHGPILLYRKQTDTVEVNVDAHGMPLGVWGQAEYDRPLEIQFAPGDVLVLVSDGFFDWMDKTDETFGTDRLRDSVYRSCRDEPNQIIERLRQDIARFNQGRHQADDTTALVIRCMT